MIGISYYHELSIIISYYHTIIGISYYHRNIILYFGGIYQRLALVESDVFSPNRGMDMDGPFVPYFGTARQCPASFQLQVPGGKVGQWLT